MRNNCRAVLEFRELLPRLGYLQFARLNSFADGYHLGQLRAHDFPDVYRENFSITGDQHGKRQSESIETKEIADGHGIGFARQYRVADASLCDIALHIGLAVYGYADYLYSAN